jgi:hypothetical protein
LVGNRRRDPSDVAARLAGIDRGPLSVPVEPAERRGSPPPPVSACRGVFWARFAGARELLTARPDSTTRPGRDGDRGRVGSGSQPRWAGRSGCSLGGPDGALGRWCFGRRAVAVRARPSGRARSPKLRAGASRSDRILILALRSARATSPPAGQPPCPSTADAAAGPTHDAGGGTEAATEGVVGRPRVRTGRAGRLLRFSGDVVAGVALCPGRRPSLFLDRAHSLSFPRCRLMWPSVLRYRRSTSHAHGGLAVGIKWVSWSGGR